MIADVILAIYSVLHIDQHLVEIIYWIAFDCTKTALFYQEA